MRTDRLRGSGRPPGVGEWVSHARLAESLQAELARVAHPARLLPAMVARPCELPWDTELLALPDDVRLRHSNHRRVNCNDVPLDTALRPEASDLLERAIVFRPAIGITGVIEALGGDHDRVRARCFGEGQGVREANRVPRGDVGWRDAATDLLEASLLRDADSLVCEGGAANCREVEIHDSMVPHVEVFRNSLPGLDLLPVSLAVIKRERDDVESFGLCHREGRRGVHPAAQQHDRTGRSHSIATG